MHRGEEKKAIVCRRANKDIFLASDVWPSAETGRPAAVGWRRCSDPGGRGVAYVGQAKANWTALRLWRAGTQRNVPRMHENMLKNAAGSLLFPNSQLCPS